MVQGDKQVLPCPRAVYPRHHAQSLVPAPRQFSVYLRILNVPVPASWGPSAMSRLRSRRWLNRPNFPREKFYVPFMHFHNGFALGRISFNRGVAALLARLRFKRNTRKLSGG